MDETPSFAKDVKTVARPLGDMQSKRDFITERESSKPGSLEFVPLRERRDRALARSSGFVSRSDPLSRMYLRTSGGFMSWK